MGAGRGVAGGGVAQGAWARAWRGKVGAGATRVSTLCALHGVVDHAALGRVQAAGRVGGGDHRTGRQPRRRAQVLPLDHAAEGDEGILREQVACTHGLGLGLGLGFG